MSKSDLNQNDHSFVVDATTASPACDASDLKGLLNTIVSQIQEADRRQADTLNQLQDRLANLGQDARTLRNKVPDKFQSAFERIEAGMAELAARISEAGIPATSSAAATVTPTTRAPSSNPTPLATLLGEMDARTFASMISSTQAPPYVPAPTQVPLPIPASALHKSASPDMAAAEPPVALRSATSPSSRRPDENASRIASGVDTFDVIESLPGDVTNPWDDDAADALADVYDSDPKTFPQPKFPISGADTPRIYAPPGSSNGASTIAFDESVDHSWLEKRFAEIAERIDTSIAEIRPDQSFFALGQRLDQFERTFTQAVENVATRNDVDSIRMIEAHMIEIVEHLESSQAHLNRIDGVEAQITSISERLDEIHALANAATAPLDNDALGSTAGFDVGALAKATADETASRLSSLTQSGADNSGLHEVRTLLEEQVSNARQSEENTNALLDTLQQAMIRLLDRMDAIEIGQHTASVSSHAALPPLSAIAGSDFTAGGAMSPPPMHDHAMGRRITDSAPIGLDEAVAAVAATKASPPSYRPHATGEPEPAPASAGPVSRQPEKLRQDFIADARRAKMRLASEVGDDSIILTNEPDTAEASAALSPPPVSKAGKSAKGAKASAASPVERKTSPISPRVIALSVALAIASGAYMMLPSGRSGTRDSGMMSQTSAPVAGAEKAPKAAPEPTAHQATDAPPPEADFGAPEKAGELNLHQLEGRLDSDVDSPSTFHPINGIAVAEQTTTADQLARARRNQAMANLSSRLGEVAAQNQATTPVALDFNGMAEPDSSATVRPQEARRGPLDLPPALVGPLSLRLAAANGDPSAEFEVGARIAEGKGPDQNFKEAAKWYQRSASKGFAQAQYRLGTLYERGLGVKTDEARAKDWYARAAGQGNVKAMHNLAVLSANGKNGSPDYALAANWFGQAAERGLADSQFNLAVLYENGLGVPTDMRQSYKWLTLAARRGDKEAVRRRDIMKGKLTATEIGEAEKLAGTFHALPTDPLINDARTAGDAWKRNAPNQS